MKGKFTERKPAISSLRRNLQSEHLQRLFDLASEREGSAAMKPIANLASMSLKELRDKLKKASENENLDAYSIAHLKDAEEQVTKFIDSQYVVNNNSGGNSFGGSFILLGKEADADR